MTPSTTEKPQHMVALEWANEVRLGQARVHRGLKDGSLSFEEAMKDPYVQNITVMRFFTWGNRWGTSRVQKMIQGLIRTNTCFVSESTLIGALTENQKKHLVRWSSK